MSEWVGRTLSKVLIQERLGRGGMAEVYLGRHTTLNRRVAVKILHAHLTGDPDLSKRFIAEAQAVASLRHPNIVQVFDFDVADGRPFIVMELVEGMSLAEYLRGLHETGVTLPLTVVARVMGSVASALDFAHSRGIVHRDIKPANILLRQGERPISPTIPLLPDVEPVLTDFGIARLNRSSIQTATGTVLGTPTYMSPEQIRGEPIDSRSDIYSMGVVLYEMLAGQPPFESDTTPAAILIKHLQEQPPPLPQVSPGVQSVVDRSLAKSPDERYQRAIDLSGDLQSVVADPTVPGAQWSAAARRARRPPMIWRRRWAIGVVGMALLLGGLALGAWALRIRGASPSHALSPTAGQFRSVPSSSEPAASTGIPAAPSGWVIYDNGTLTAQIDSVPAAPPAFTYQAWLIGSNGAPTTLGEFEPVDGQLSFAYQSPDSSSLLAHFPGMMVSLEPHPDPDPATPGRRVYSAHVPAELASLASQLTEVAGDGPITNELLAGTGQQVVHYQSHLSLSLQSIEDGNLDGGRRHAEHVINILEGRWGSDYGDWNGDGLTENPGDDFGLIPYLTFLNTMVEQAQGAPSSAPFSQATVQDVGQQARALLNQATSARDLATRVASADTLEEVQPLVPELRALALRPAVEALLEDAQGVQLAQPIPVLQSEP